MKKKITINFLMIIVSIGLFAQQGTMTLSFKGVNSNNQNIEIDSVLVENVTQNYSTTLVKPNLSITITWPLGIEENNSQNFSGSLIYPNPFSDYAFISINNRERQKVTVTVVDNSGKTICDDSRELPNGIHKYQFYSGIAGIYQIIISNGRQKTVLKAVSTVKRNTESSRLNYIGVNGESINGLKTSQTITNFPFQPGDVLRFTGYAPNYPNVSITDTPGTNKNYTFTFSQFYRLSKQLVETAPPSFVNIMFQVTDEDYSGIDNLATSSFVVKEDDQTVSPTETFMYIKKMASIPYQMKTVLLLDNSASVAPNLGQIKNAAITLVNNIVDKQQVAILVFSDKATLLTGFTDNIDTLVDAIESIELGFPSTDLYGSIIEAVSKWNDSYSMDLIQQGFLVALTDGDDTQGSHTLNQALNAIGNKRVYMIGLGNEINPDALEQLANPGPFYNPDQADELVEIFSEIQNDIVKYANSFYWMNYMSPKREGSHNLRLEVENNINTGNDSYITGNFSANSFFSVYSGVYINASQAKPYGIDTLYISDSATTTLKATTYWANNPPEYEWATNDAGKIEIIPDELDNSKINIFAHGDSLDFATITITDISNGYANSVFVEIDGYGGGGSEGTFTDPRDGQTYNIVTIGDQEWFAENLNYQTGNSWCYDNNPANCDVYGRLYNWNAALTACPSGWHLPSDDEWKILEMFLGMSQSQANQTGWRGTDEGKKLKSTSGWNSNGNGSDEVGFTALPGGDRNTSGGFDALVYGGLWWSATETSSSYAWRHYLYYNNDDVNRDKLSKTYGFSVRCVRD